MRIPSWLCRTSLRWLLCCAIVSVFAPAAVAQMGDEWLSDSIPSRPRIETWWQPLAMPMGEMDILAAARRLGLTREQLIALESRLPAYLEQACESRRRANRAIADVGISDWQNSNATPSREDVHKTLGARQSYERDLARLDSALWDDLTPLLNEPQQALLLRERLRRDRRRMLTDGIVIDWASRSQLLMEIGDMVEQFELSQEQRDAARALVTEFESQATTRLRSLFELAINYEKDWVEARKPDEHPHQSWQSIAASRTAAAQELVELEYQWVDRIAGVLSPELASKFREAHAGAHPSTRSWADTSYFTSLADAALGLDGIDPAVREEIAAKAAEMLKLRSESLPELINLTRRLGVSERVRVGGGGYYGMSMEEYQRQMPLRERQQALQQELWGSFSSLQQLLQSRLSEEQRKAIAEAEVALRKERQQPVPEYQRTNEFGNSNVVTMISMGGSMDVSVPSSAPRCSAATLQALGLSADQQAGADGVLMDCAERWSGQRQAYLALATPLLQFWGRPEQVMDVEAHDADSKKAVELLLAMRNLEPETLESLKLIIGNDALASLTLAAQRWADAAARPGNFPAPIEIVRTSHYRTMTTQLDRIDPATILLQLGPPSEATAAAWQTLLDDAPVAQERIWKLRQAVAEAYLSSSRSMRFQQQTMRRQQEDPQQQQAFWKRYQTLQQASSASCQSAQRLRREHLDALATMHQTVAGLLPADLQPRYAEAISREAFPDAWAGVDRAQRIIDRALGLPDATDAQKQQIRDACLEQQGKLRDAAHTIEQHIANFVKAEDMTREAPARCAPLYAEVEQAMFERDEAALAMLRLLRPILTAAQMTVIEESESSQR